MKRPQTIGREVRRLIQIESELRSKGSLSRNTRDVIMGMRFALRWALDDGDGPIDKRWMPPSSWLPIMWLDEEQREIVRRIMR